MTTISLSSLQKEPHISQLMKIILTLATNQSPKAFMEVQLFEQNLPNSTKLKNTRQRQRQNTCQHEQINDVDPTNTKGQRRQINFIKNSELYHVTLSLQKESYLYDLSTKVRAHFPSSYKYGTQQSGRDKSCQSHNRLYKNIPCKNILICCFRKREHIKKSFY